MTISNLLCMLCLMYVFILLENLRTYKAIGHQGNTKLQHTRGGHKQVESPKPFHALVWKITWNAMYDTCFVRYGAYPYLTKYLSFLACGSTLVIMLTASLPQKYLQRQPIRAFRACHNVCYIVQTYLNMAHLKRLDLARIRLGIRR